jgi:hypothetical protein
MAPNNKSLIYSSIIRHCGAATVIDALERLDKRTAAGILARAALALDSAGNPAAREVVEHEAEIRRAILHEARSKLGLYGEDNSPDEIGKLTDYLDEQSERLTGSPDPKDVFKRLLESGHLPSDLYRIQIDKTVVENLGAYFKSEEHLIRQTVFSPSREQHFGSHKIAGLPNLISLFSRRYHTPFPYKNFIMLVAGQRHGENILHISQAWRIYPSLVNTAGAKDLVGLLKDFADRYGCEIKIGDKVGRFFLSSETLPPSSINVDLKGKNTKVNVAQFFQNNNEGKQTAALTIATNLDLYLSDLKAMKAEIID